MPNRNFKKQANRNFKKQAKHIQTSRTERRKAERNAKKQAKRDQKSFNEKHEKALTGTHFIRIATWETIDAGADVRMYAGPDQTPFTEETGREAFEMIVGFGQETGVQLFTADNEVVVENIGLLYGHTNPEKEFKAMVAVSDDIYQLVLASIQECGVGYTWSKHNRRREIRLYKDEPYEFHCRLPLRKLANMKVLQEESLAAGGKGLQMHPDGHLAPFLTDAIAKGMDPDAALTEAFAAFHESQGRSRETVKDSTKPGLN